MLRRTLLSGTAGAAVLAGSGCALLPGGGTPASAMAMVAQMVQVFGSDLTTFFNSMQALGNQTWLTAALEAKVQAAVAAINNVAAQITVALTTAQAQPLLQQLESAFETLLPLLAGLPIPGNILMYVQMAAAVLPLLFGLLGLAVPPAATTNAMMAAAAAKTVSLHPLRHR